MSYSTKTFGARWAWVLLTATLAACGGGGGGSTTAPDAPPPAVDVTVNGSVEALPSGSSVTIHIEGVGRYAASTNGSFSVHAGAGVGSRFFTLLTDSDRHCTVTGGNGVLANVVSGMRVNCQGGAPWVTDGPIGLMRLSPDEQTLYVAGLFGRIGPATGNWVAIDPDDGSYVPPIKPLPGEVTAITSDGRGGYYVAMRSVHNTQDRDAQMTRLVRYSVTGAIDLSFNAQVNGLVRSMAVVAGKLFVGGYFQGITWRRTVQPISFATETRYNLAALDPTTGTLLPWRLDMNNVAAIADVQGQLVVNGQSSPKPGGGASCVMIVDTTTPTYRSLQDASLNCATRALAFDGSRLYFADSDFNPTIATEFGRVTAIEWAAPYKTAWSTRLGANEDVVKLLVADGLVWLGGQFRDYAGDPGSAVTALRADTGSRVTAPWYRDVAGTVKDMAWRDGKIFIAGDFQEAASGAASSVAVANVAAGTWSTSLGDRVGAGVTLLNWSGTKLWLGGRFGLYGGVKRLGLAALDVRTGQATDWNPNQGCSQSQPLIQDMVVAESLVVVSGPFRCMGGAARESLALIDAATGAVNSFDAQLDAGSGVRLAHDGTTLVMAGNFASVAGQSRHNLASIDLQSLRLSTWAPDSSQVYAVAADGGRVFTMTGAGWNAYNRDAGSVSPLWTLPSSVNLGALNFTLNLVPQGNSLFIAPAPSLFAVEERDVATGALRQGFSFGGLGFSVLQRCGSALAGFVFHGQVNGQQVQVWSLSNFDPAQQTLGPNLVGLNGEPQAMACGASGTYIGGRFEEWYPASLTGAYPQSSPFGAWLPRAP